MAAAASAKALFSLVPGKTRIGWIGTGVMGNSMAGHIHRSGLYPVTCYNRSQAKTEILRSAGVKVASSVADLAANSDVIFTIVGYPSDVRSVILGEDGVLKHCAKGSVIVDMTTSEPSLAKEIATAAAQKGVHTLDCPVSGGDIGAKEARLSIMVGGEKEIMDGCMPLFEMMGKLITYCGPAGAGQHTKMMNQILIASGMIGVVEGLLYAHKAGLDLDTAIRAVSAGAAGSWSISNLGPRIVQRNFDPGFFVEHFVKDMGIALAEAQRMNLALPGLSMANQFYIALCAQGHGRKGTHALALALEQLNGIQRPYKQ